MLAILFVFPSNLKSFLKHVCNVYDFLSSKAVSFPNQQCYEMTLDLIESRIYNPPTSKNTKTKPKNLIKLHFVNKGMDMINISKIINDKNVKKSLPTQFNKTEQISTVYKSTVCSYHVTYAFQSESILYSCLNVKELLARSRREI